MQIPGTGYVTLSAMITPAIFLTANGSLIISTSNRMSRVVDRIRVLNDQGDRICRGDAALDFPGERMAHLRDQIDRLVRRGELIRYALMMLYLAFGAFVVTSLVLALDTWTGHFLYALPTATAVSGVLLMLGACINQVFEVREALRSNRLEVRFYRDLHDRRRGDCDDRPPS